MTDVLTLDALGVSFPDVVGPPAVDGVSLSIGRGEVVALVGESGSGKTLTARALLGLLPPAARAVGRLRIGDVALDLASRTTDERAWQRLRGRRVALVFQEPQSALNPVRTVGWQLTEALRAHGRTDRRARAGRVAELLGLVGLAAELSRRFPHELSGGQKQRVVIALALANEPDVLVADEPTTALDVTVQAEILRLLADLRDRLGTAVLLITHSMGVVAELADRVVVLRGGRMVEQGEVVSLFSAPFTDYTRTLLAAVPRLPAAGSSVGGTAGTPDGTAAAETRAPAVRVSEVSVSYRSRFDRGTTCALDGVSLALASGSVLGVVGESGSGKTTLARVITGALAPTRGRVEVAGVDLATVRGAAKRQLRRGVGLVQQDPATTLDPLLSVADSVAEPLQLHRVLRGAALRARVAELLSDVGLGAAYAERRPSELSGGQRQRVALARALALRPGLLVADEPTSALDVSVQAQVLALFADLQAEYGFACLFISHDLAVVHQVSDDVLVLRNGRVVETGPTEQVLRNPTDAYTRALVDAVPSLTPSR